VTWWMLQARGCATAAQSVEMSLEQRLWFLVASKADPAGHAHFGSTLGDHLRKPDEVTGEMKPVTSRHLRKLIAKGVRCGIYAPQSSVRCIVIPAEIHDCKLSTRATPCPEHGHNLRTGQDGTWFDWPLTA
jgi:hypothetical protein